MTTLTTLTLQPNSTLQLGSWSVVGAGSASAALSDGSDATYVQLPSGICRLETQVCRLGFPTPTLPAGAQIYSVGIRRRIQSVVAGSDIPLCYHWLRTSSGTIQVAGQNILPLKQFFNSPCPTSPTTATWTVENVVTVTTGPGGQPWTLANLTGIAYDLGRGDASTTSALRVSEVYLDITYQQLSTVTVTAPTSTIADTRPTVKWTYASPDSQPQQAYQVAVYTLAQTLATGFSSFVTTPIEGTGGYVLGEDQQWALTSDLVDGQYVAYVQCQSVWGGPGAFYTGVASTSWTRQAYSSSVPPWTTLSTQGPPLTAVLNSTTFDALNNRVGLTFQPGAQPTISAVGSAATSGGTGTTTLSVSPTAVGDVLVLATNLTSTTLSVSSVAGGGVTTWARIAGPFVGSSGTIGMWMGQVTTAGSATITVTGSGSLASTTVRLLAQQFTSTRGALTQWGLAVASNGVTNASSTTVTYPTIVPDGTNQVYIGYARTANAGSTSGQTAGYTVQLDNGSNPFIYGPNVAVSQSPTSVQTSAGVSSAVGALIVAGEPTTAFTVQASRDGGVTWTAIPSLTYLPVNGMNPITAYDYVANLNVVSQYRVIAYAGSPFVAATLASNVLTATPVGNQFWLKSPDNPLLNTVLPVAAPKDANSGIKITKRRLMGTFHLVSGPGSQVLPVVVSGPTYGDAYEIELIFVSGDLNYPMTLWSAVDQLDRTGGTLLFQKPDGDQLWVRLGPGASGQETEEQYNAFPGDPTQVFWRRRKVILTPVDPPDFY